MNKHEDYTYMSLLKKECAEERKSVKELPVLDKTGGETVTFRIYPGQDCSFLLVLK